MWTRVLVCRMWINTDLVVDLLDVVWMSDQHVLVDQFRPEGAPVLWAAAHRQRSFELFVHP